MILGRVLSKAADVSILKFISDHILNPLEMKDTVWNTESLGRQLGFCYDQDKLKAETGFVVKDDSAVFAGLWSSVAKYSKWIAFLLDADHHMTSEFESILSATSQQRELQSSMVYAPPRDSSLLSNEYVHYHGFGFT